jgi:hypothetical protein
MARASPRALTFRGWQGRDCITGSRTAVKSDFLCNLGSGHASKLFPRSPRLDFNEAIRNLVRASSR